MTNYDYLYDKEYYGSALTADHFREKRLKWKAYAGGTVLPHRNLQGIPCGGLLDEQSQYIDGTGIHRGLGAAYDVSDADIKEQDEEIVFLGIWPDIWGHCLTDNIRRLWVIQDDDFMSRYGSLRFAFVAHNNRKPGKNFQDLLSILGTDDVRLETIDEITRFTKVILPDECFWREDDGTRVFTKEYRQLVDKLRNYGEKQFRPTNERKLYFSYRRYASFRSVGERKIEKYLASIGYRIISPENYTFEEQLNMLLNCTDFVSTVGSASHNSIFLRDGSKVCLIPRAGFITEYQLALDQVHDLEITYVDSSLSLYVWPDRQWEGPFFFIVSRQLQDYLGRIIGYREDRLGFYIYRCLALSKYNISRPINYYRNIGKEYISTDIEKETRETVIIRLMRRQKLRKLVSLLLRKLRRGR